MNHGLSFEYDREQYSPAAPVITGIVHKISSSESGVELTFLLDTGADATMLPFEVLETVGARFLELRQMRGVTGKALQVETYLCTITIGPYVIHGLQVVALAEGAEPILGRDVLNNLVTTLNGLAGIIEIHDGS